MLVPKLRFKEFNNEWNQKSFEEIFVFLQNNSFSRDYLNYDNETSILDIHYGDILVKFSNILSVEGNPLIPKINSDVNVSKFIESSYLKDGDIIFADTAEDLTVGKAIEIKNIQNNKVLSGLHTIPCRSNIKFAPNYLGFYINSSVFHNQLIPYITGIKVSSISKSNIVKTFISFPSFEEQNKIGKMIELLDKKIELQQKKIEALKIYKKGLIQKLIDFNNYPERSVSEFGTIITGATPSKLIPSYWNNGTIVWVTPSDITESKDIYTSYDMLTVDGLSAGRFIPAGSVLVTCIASIGKNAILKTDGSCNQQINAIIPNENFNADYLYYLFEMKKDYLQSIAGTSATSIINKSSFEKLVFKVPSIEQQNKSSKILNCLELKIENEKFKLKKLNLLKKSLLQQMFI